MGMYIGAIRRESTREVKGPKSARDKNAFQGKIRPGEGRGGDNLLCDPGSESRLLGRERKGENMKGDPGFRFVVTLADESVGSEYEGWRNCFRSTGQATSGQGARNSLCRLQLSCLLQLLLWV